VISTPSSRATLIQSSMASRTRSIASLVRGAGNEGVSLNQFVTNALAGAVGWRSRPVVGDDRCVVADLGPRCAHGQPVVKAELEPFMLSGVTTGSRNPQQAP